MLDVEWEGGDAEMTEDSKLHPAREVATSSLVWPAQGINVRWLQWTEVDRGGAGHNLVL
jgi:hypothetical protein